MSGLTMFRCMETGLRTSWEGRERVGTASEGASCSLPAPGPGPATPGLGFAAHPALQLGALEQARETVLWRGAGDNPGCYWNVPHTQTLCVKGLGGLCVQAKCLRGDPLDGEAL